MCEIGGGLGTLAYYLSKTDASSVAIADLPIVSVMQGYYLLKSLGPEQVCLSGEGGAAKVKLMPFWELDQLPDASVSMFINIDSMPEIDADSALHYIELIREKCSGRFYSINHETRFNDQNVVQDLVERVGGLRRIHRSPHWMMKGYVEELYEQAH